MLDDIRFGLKVSSANTEMVKNIFINAIAPGPINTRMLDEVLEAGVKKVGKQFYEKSKQQKKDGGTDVSKIIQLIEFLSHKKSNGISGKLISVLWDNWQNFHKKINILKKSDIGTLRRITGKDRNLNFFDRE
jgi:3-oxoacyl-[acyl-carrier protein] reductase